MLTVTTWLRLVFPTVTANQSAVAVLPRFVEVLGTKLDKINTEKDWYDILSYCSSSLVQHVDLWSSMTEREHTICRKDLLALRLLLQQRFLNARTTIWKLVNSTLILEAATVIYNNNKKMISLRLSEQISELYNKMQDYYNDLATQLSEATVHPETFDKSLGHLQTCSILVTSLLKSIFPYRFHLAWYNLGGNVMASKPSISIPPSSMLPWMACCNGPSGSDEFKFNLTLGTVAQKHHQHMTYPSHTALTLAKGYEVAESEWHLGWPKAKGKACPGQASPFREIQIYQRKT